MLSVHFVAQWSEDAMTYDFPVNGDIIFTSDDRLVLATQTLLRGRRAKWSHVMITVSQEGALHSVPKKGVTIESWDALFASRQFSDGRLKAYRSPKVDYFGLPVFEEAKEVYGARYNSVFMFREFPILRRIFLRSFFCSELAAKFLVRQGVRSEKAPMRMFPVDLEQTLRGQGWLDVSNIYERVLSSETSVTESGRDFLAKMRGVIEFWQISKKMLEETLVRDEEINEFMRQISEDLKRETERLERAAN
jgi:hypothetical protein